ncbi:BRCA1-associated ATM activator 1 [Pristis pectinata]|uniref:BRCA1-associated ATM activator 1 n=1 Tax=Pristis pectinata TaxID=685728 RepID=UPI00223D4E8B|nr:BRCA1-associated ATM activator 1 [Pristis pectinata]XP_051876873.1 BRCA1-associated ATM activator 1 [Pristis pectinata]XP_051876875.1 BRCA1-associated ATM activator 1 [Pristis pectinata]
MESDYAELLPRVCAVLGDTNKSVVDDTCLEKLLDCFQAITGNETELCILQKNPCLANIVSASKHKDLNPSILSFIMRLTGLLAASEEHFCKLEADGIMSSLFGNPANLETKAWKDATVRCGWLLGIQSMLQHEAVIHFLCKHDCISEIIWLQRDPSIFVASTASQLLANILSFSLQHSELAALETSRKIQLTDTIGTVTGLDSTVWSVCVCAITEHIEGFLKSNITSNIQQALKLLSKVSVTCNPVCIASLWSKVEGSVKLLLNGDLTKIGQPLAELFLNISRTVPCEVLQSNTWELLSLLLRSLNQAEALALASGVVKLQNCPQALRMQAMATLFHPLNYIFNVTKDTTVLLDESSNCRVDTEHHLFKKSTCISLICQTLSHLCEFLQMPSQVIDLPYQALTNSVLTILQLCIGTAVPTTSAGVNISRHLISCIKVQRAGMDVIGAIAQWTEGIKEVENALNLLLDYVRNPDTDCTVLKKTLQALLQWILSCIKAEDSHMLENKLQEFLHGDFISIMKKRLFDVHWEIRDSTVEFLGELCFQFKEIQSFSLLIGTCGLPHLVLELLSDSESYVRASGIIAVGKMDYLSPNWQTLSNERNFTAVKGNILSHLLDILNQDTEGFPRRAVVKVFVDWVKNSHKFCSCEMSDVVPVVLKIGSYDLDWEVKLYSLELAEAFIDWSAFNLSLNPYAIALPNNICSTQVRGFVQNLCDTGIFDILFHALWDCDRPVAQKACKILMKLKMIVSHADNIEIAKNLNGYKPNSESFNSWLSHNDLNLKNVNDVLEVLIALDLECQHQHLACSSDHIESSLRSLLQDILAAAENSEENDADCY